MLFLDPLFVVLDLGQVAGFLGILSDARLLRRRHRRCSGRSSTSCRSSRSGHLRALVGLRLFGNGLRGSCLSPGRLGGSSLGILLLRLTHALDYRGVIRRRLILLRRLLCRSGSRLGCGLVRGFRSSLWCCLCGGLWCSLGCSLRRGRLSSGRGCGLRSWLVGGLLCGVGIGRVGSLGGADDGSVLVDGDGGVLGLGRRSLDLLEVAG